jgi:hypothetical protein
MPGCVELVFLQGEARDWERLALGTRLFHPIVATAGNVAAVTYLRHDALKADAARMGEHFPAVDVKAFAELNMPTSSSQELLI